MINTVYVMQLVKCQNVYRHSVKVDSATFQIYENVKHVFCSKVNDDHFQLNLNK